LLPHAVNCGRFCFWRRQSVVFGCVGYEISRKTLNGFAPNSHGRRVWSLAHSSLKVKVKGQRSSLPGTKGIFRPFRQPACGLFGKTSLASSFKCCMPRAWCAGVLLTLKWPLSYCQVQARNDVQVGDGWGDLSASVSHVTQDGVPSAPSSLVRISRSDTCITVSWRPPYTPNGVIISYRVRR